MSSMATPPRPNFNLNNVIAPDIGGSLVDFANQQSKQFQLGLSSVMAEAQARRAEEQAIRANEQAEREKINFDRLNKDREALVNFNKGMLQPQVISGIVTDTIAPEQVDRMSFTPEELAQYNAAGGDLSKLTGSARTKAELQTKLSNFADTLPSSPEFQESNYQQAQRVASSMELTPGILEELKKYQVADVLAQKENKKEGTTYLGEAKELEAQIAQLKTKQGAIQDKAAGLGKEWGKRTNNVTADGKEIATFGYADLSKFVKEAAKTDSDKELFNMLKTAYDDPNLTKKQKEDAANNILISSGAYNSQGMFDLFKKNVDIAAAQKANEEFFANIKDPNKSDKIDSSEVKGLANEISMLEARRNSALAKANSYSDGDRTSSARALMGSRLEALLGGNSMNTSTGALHGDNAIKAVESREGPLTEEMKYVIKNEGFSNTPYMDKAGSKEVETIGVGQTGDYKNKTFKETYEDRLRILKSKVPDLDNLPSEVKKTLIDNHYRGEIGSKTIQLINEGKFKEAGEAFLQRKDYHDQTPNQIKSRIEGLANALKSSSNKDVDVKSLFAKVEESRNSKGKDAQEVVDYYIKKREDIANIKTNAWDRTVNAFKGGPTVDDGYGKLTGKSYSKDISNVSDSLRKDGFNSVEDIAILATNMPEGKDKEAVANVLHYKLMQSDPEYRQLMKEQEVNDAAWLAAETILSAVPVGKVVGNVARRVVGPGTHTTALPNGWAGTTGREAMEKAATQAAAEKAATKAAMQKRIAALEHDLQQLGGELSKNKVGSGMTRSGLENDFARIRKAQKELQDRLKSL